MAFVVLQKNCLIFQKFMSFPYCNGITFFRAMYFLLITTCFLLGCGEEGHTPDFQKFTVSGFIDQDPNFSILSEALQLTGIGDTLEGGEDFTLMAPSNRAFTKIGIQSVNDKSAEEWERLLRYHIVKGAHTPDSLLNEIRLTMLDDYYWFVTENDGQLLVNGEVKVLLQDLTVANGKIYGIDAVLDPLELNLLNVAANKGYSIFVSALEKAALEEELSGSGPFTLFVPNDVAFETFFEDIGLSQEEWLATENLKAFLQYFIIEGEWSSEELEPGMLRTQSGDTAFVSKGQENAIWINGQAKLTQPDIQGGNGLIHEVDMVFTSPQKSLATLISEIESNKDYSEFEAALIYAGLLGSLEGDASGPFTVFAPSNEALATWYDEMEVDGYYEVEGSILREVLQYHIALGRVFTQDFSDGQSLETLLEGNEVMLSIDGTMVNGVMVDADYRNQHATNGVLHGISGVLIP